MNDRFWRGMGVIALLTLGAIIGWKFCEQKLQKPISRSVNYQFFTNYLAGIDPEFLEASKTNYVVCVTDNIRPAEATRRLSAITNLEARVAALEGVWSIPHAWPYSTNTGWTNLDGSGLIYRQDSFDAEWLLITNPPTIRRLVTVGKWRVETNGTKP